MNAPVPLSTTLGRLTENSLSTRARIGHVALLLVALGMSTLVAALLLTETALPARSAVALAAMLVIGLSWVTYAAWVLRHRRTLLANHRVVAARMAVAFSALFVASTAWLAFAGGQRSMAMAAMLGGVMSIVAMALLVRAHRYRARLSARRRELEHALSQAQS
jgi:hypothetical protein